MTHPRSLTASQIMASLTAAGCSDAFAQEFAAARLAVLIEAGALVDADDLGEGLEAERQAREMADGADAHRYEIEAQLAGEEG